MAGLVESFLKSFEGLVDIHRQQEQDKQAQVRFAVDTALKQHQEDVQEKHYKALEEQAKASQEATAEYRKGQQEEAKRRDDEAKRRDDLAHEDRMAAIKKSLETAAETAKRLRINTFAQQVEQGLNSSRVPIKNAILDAAARLHIPEDDPDVKDTLTRYEKRYGKEGMEKPLPYAELQIEGKRATIDHLSELTTEAAALFSDRQRLAAAKAKHAETVANTLDPIKARAQALGLNVAKLREALLQDRVNVDVVAQQLRIAGMRLRNMKTQQSLEFGPAVKAYDSMLKTLYSTANGNSKTEEARVKDLEIRLNKARAAIDMWSDPNQPEVIDLGGGSKISKKNAISSAQKTYDELNTMLNEAKTARDNNVKLGKTYGNVIQEQMGIYQNMVTPSGTINNGRTAIPHLNSKAEVQKLKPGEFFIWKDGNRYQRQPDAR